MCPQIPFVGNPQEKQVTVPKSEHKPLWHIADNSEMAMQLTSPTPTPPARSLPITVPANHGVVEEPAATIPPPPIPTSKRKRTTKSARKPKRITKLSSHRKTPRRNQASVFKKGSKCPQVSNKGRFRSTRGVVTRPKPSADGYVRVRIMNSNYYLHSLICLAFWGQAPTLAHTVDHIDNNPSNNNVDNLRWLTQAEQVKHSYATNSQTRKQCRPPVQAGPGAQARRRRMDFLRQR